MYKKITGRLLASLLALIILTGLAACSGGNGYISKDEASEIALSRLDGSTLSTITLTTASGLAVYAGNLDKGGVSYRFEIDAETGTVIRFGTTAELDAEDSASASQESVQRSDQVESSSADGYIGEESAVAACLTQYPDGLDNSVTLSDYEGAPVYIVNLTSGGTTFDMYVNARTGEIIDTSAEAE